MCERAGFSRGAFYSNFDSKDELFVALYERQTSRILETLTALDQTGPTLDDVMAELVAAVPLDRRWYLVNAEFTLHAVRTPAAAAVLAGARARVRAAFAERLAEILARFHRRATVPVDDLIRWLFALHEGGLSQAYVEPDRVAPNTLTRQAAPLLLAAVTRRR
jgi:AcrR family transcriptional regulator